jgi:hypothetical protein
MNISLSQAVAIIGIGVPAVGGAYLLRAQVAENAKEIQVIKKNVGPAGALARYTFCKEMEELPVEECKKRWMREVAQMEATEEGE